MYESWEELKCECSTCQKCPLGATRTNLGFGVGNENAEVLFIGEGPGEQEDLKGEPFVGRSGQLLDKYMEAIGLDRKKNICYNNSDEGVSSTCFPLPSHHLTSYRPASAGFYLHKRLQKLHKLEPSSQLPDIFPDFFIFL
jgi:hypothetical protein